MMVPIKQGKPAQTFRVQLGDTTVRFHVFYVRRREAWYFHLDDSQGNRLLSGVRLASLYPLLRQYQSDADLPQGLLMLTNDKGIMTEVDRDSLGDSHFLLYEETA